MKLVIGQRYMSDMEPELGLGVVLALAHKRITLGFSSSERTYSTDNPPIRRIIFREGEEISLVTGDIREVNSVREEDGIYYYCCGDDDRCGDDEISEALLSDTICFTTPLERLLGGLSDSNREFLLRKQVLEMQAMISRSPARGFTGGKIELFPHQLSVTDSICSSSKRRFFLADEVGLGKTIEACLTIHRLLLTGRIERVLIVVPSALIHQWFVELYRRFSILSTIVNDDFISRFNESEENLFDFESPVIISMEELSSGGEITDAICSSSWDMLVVDEAHHLTDGSDDYETVSALSAMIPGLMLLTASPEAMEEKNFFSLLQLVDPIKYSDMDLFKEEQNRYREVATLADSLLSKNKLSEDEENFLHEVLPEMSEIDLSKLIDEEIEDLVMKLTDICGVGRAIFRNSRSVISGFPKRSVSVVHVKGDDGGEVFSKDLGLWIDQFLREHESEKCLLICKNRERMKRINRMLSKNKSRKISLFHEDMSIVQLDRSAAWFADSEGASLLISTEIGSEGRNFQYADHLILADLPEEPELLEQRIGRLDRIGRSGLVSIIVPVIAGSEQSRLADWYDRGLDAFCHTVPGAHRIGLDFIKAVLNFSGTAAKWEKLIKETKVLRNEISERVQNGRNRLLELASCNLKRAQVLTQQVADQENCQLEALMQNIFEYYGIFMDDLAQHLFHLDFDTVTDHTFPIPMMREEDGMSVTFNRKLALEREDVDFLSIDHPMVLGAFELMLGGEKGNCSVARLPDAGEEGFLVEMLFVLTAPGGTSLFPERYFPANCVRILLDDAGDDVGDVFSEQFLKDSLQESTMSLFNESGVNAEKEIKPIIAEAVEEIKALCAELIKKAANSIENEYSAEIDRISRLSNDAEEIALISFEKSELLANVKGAGYRLEAVRLITLEN